MERIGEVTREISNKLQTTELSGKISGWKPTIEEYEPSLVVAAAACAKFVADMERGADPYWLTFSGRTGCGKTKLALQLFTQGKRLNPGDTSPIWPPDFATNGHHKHEPGQRPKCQFLDEQAIADWARSGEYDVIADAKRDFLAVIDDLGVSRDPTAFISDVLMRICAHRMNRWTIFTTNLTLQEVSRERGARIASRLIRDANRLVTITADDYAKRKFK